MGSLDYGGFQGFFSFFGQTCSLVQTVRHILLQQGRCSDHSDCVLPPPDNGVRSQKTCHCPFKWRWHRLFARNRNRGVYFRKKYGFCADDKIVVTAALPIERKGINEFIELARRMNDVHFVWFGSLEAILIPRKIKAAIAAAPSNVHFAGFVTQAELAGAYSGADCFLFMSREETEGIAVLEALSCSIPVVLKDIPAYSGLAEEGLDVCLFHTLDECEERVRHVLSHDMSALSEKERSLAKERDLSLIWQRLREVYQQIVKLKGKNMTGCRKLDRQAH